MLGIFRVVLLLVEVISSLLLIALILVQKSRDQGLGLAFGSGMGETLFGSRAGNVLTKMTVVLSIVFLANTTLLCVVFSRSEAPTSLMSQVGAAPMAPAGAPAAAPESAPLMAQPATEAPLMTTETAPLESINPVAVEAAPAAPAAMESAPATEPAPMETAPAAAPAAP